MKIYLIRHGQTDWNNKQIIQGRTDNKLNEVGQIQAEEVAQKLKAVTPTKLIATPLVRSQETLEIIKTTNKWNLELNCNEGFIERDFGEFEKTNAEKYKEVTDYSVYERYEQDFELEKRVDNALKGEIKNASDKDVLLIVAHSHVMKSFLVYNFEDEYDYKYLLPNCAIIEIIIEDEVIEKIQIF